MSEPGAQSISDKGQREIPVSTPSRPTTGTERNSSGSPQRPSYSPVTPTLSQASLASQDGTNPGTDLPPAQWMDEPPEALPVSLDDNADAIALRATLSILQIQRQQALNDMRELDRMKKAALEDSEAFVQDLQAGNLSRPARTDVEVDDDMQSSAAEGQAKETSKFGRFPAAQNVVRTPPVEWAKYHIAGEPLDRIHRTQQQYPGATEEMFENPDRPQPHTIAAPYRPFTDKLQEPKSGSKSNQRTSES